ncbi:YceI family protein [Pelomonas sp. APW6]|uniref:YceI family protein n=1 Tax=Roseateles subflavus TaxID=3053353 RepID=A0ABT7LED9_9BURK|nr:YceI family protein [Pelomonas sp. APW6]MDL5030565.1 YceI family protein [Pelomonas sp. APW6]
MSLAPPRRRALLVAAAALLLSACAGPVPSAAPSAPGDDHLAPEPVGGAQWRVDPAGSLLQVLAFRQGALSGLGHNHVVTAPQLQGWLQTPAEAADPSRLSAAQLAATRFALALRLDELQLDDPVRRAPLGPAFASVPGPDAIAATRTNLLGEAMLDAARFPGLRVQSVALRGEGAHVLAEIEIDWHGQRRRWRLPLTLSTGSSPEGQVLRVQGQMALRLTDFGIQPLSLLGGMLAVQDDLGVTLDLLLRPR